MNNNKDDKSIKNKNNSFNKQIKNKEKIRKLNKYEILDKDNNMKFNNNYNKKMDKNINDRLNIKIDKVIINVNKPIYLSDKNNELLLNNQNIKTNDLILKNKFSKIINKIKNSIEKNYDINDIIKPKFFKKEILNDNIKIEIKGKNIFKNNNYKSNKIIKYKNKGLYLFGSRINN